MNVRNTPGWLEAAHACTDCAEACLATIPHCLEKGGRHAKATHITLLQVCADICRTTSQALLLGADVMSYTCMACAAICERCAADCEELRDRSLEDCVEACLECADACRRMVHETGSAAVSA
jgi:hypothetical protein